MRISVLQKAEVFKLDQTSKVAGVDVPNNTNRLCVYDRDTRERFLVDTGAEISVLAATGSRKMKTSSDYRLYAANNTPIKTYGEKTLKLNLGLRRNFSWTFIIADVRTSILGADFLRHYKLLIDLHRKKLIDKVTELTINAFEVNTSEETIHIINHDQVYHDILIQYPELLRPMSLKQPAKHDVIHHIETSSPPLFAQPRPLPPDKYQAAKEEFNKMLEMGICTPSKSPWASPLHVVKKKDGGLRVCGDYRRLNAVTLPDRYPIPRIQDFTYQLRNMKIFSKLDIRMAYYWIPIAKEDAQKTAITTPFGLFEFKCMTFGLRNASQTFQRFMHEVLRGIDHCFCFVDDILLYSEDEESHKDLLRQVLERLNKYGITLKIEKCEFGKETINFLGYNVSMDGIKPTEDRIKAISNYPKPKTIAELRRFLGIINFYRSCLPHQAELQAELNKYLHNRKRNDKTPIEWTTQADKAFEKCRQSILEATTLVHPIIGAPLAIMTDASDCSLGAVLQQKEQNKWKPLAYFSKAMSATQRRYSVYDRELLAMYTAVKHFRRLIEGCEATVFTDHKPLAHALNRPASNADTPKRERQLQFISQFCANIEYVRGEENAVADALSRIEELHCPSPIDYGRLSQDQRSNPELEQLKKQTNLKFSDVTEPGINRPITCEMSTGKPRPYLPPRYRFVAFKAQHDLCHPGVRATRKQIGSKFFWPKMNQDINNWARGCIECQRAKIHRHTTTPLGEFPPSERFEHIHIDIVGPLRLSNNCRYCLTIIDRCTRWPEAIPLVDITAESVTQALYDNWITRFGCPSRISTDQGRQFESSLFNSLVKKFGISRIRTTAYHPQSNGLIERWHRTLKAALMARGNSTQWTNELPTVLLGLRTALRSNSEFSPAMMTYGTTLRLPSDFITPSVEPNCEENEYIRRLMDTMASLRSTSCSNHTRREPFIHKDLAKCTHVFVRNDKVVPPLTPPYEGPYEVVERYDKFFKIKLPLRTAVISMDRLKPAYIINGSFDDTTDPSSRTSNQPYVTKHGRVVKPIVRFA